MLVLSRKKREEIKIGKNAEICVRVLGVERGRVKLGISAPQDIPILRAELELKEDVTGEK